MVTEKPFAAMQVAADDRILEVNCGHGEVARRLAALAANGLVVGIDKSDEAVREARRQSASIDNVMFAIGAPEEIPWKENYFSLVLCNAPVEDWKRAVAEVFRVTAPGGRGCFPQAPPEAEAGLRDAGFEVRGRLPLEGRKP